MTVQPDPEDPDLSADLPWLFPLPADDVRRHLADAMAPALADTPVVYLNGPRQCGKTTLAKQLARELGGAQSSSAESANAPVPYFTLDDPALAAVVKRDPLGFVRQATRQSACAVIDEVQRVPELLLAVKLVVDEDRRPGRFLLTGSANVMALPQMADSLAGRMEVFELMPFSQGELKGEPSDFLQRALAKDWPVMRRDWVLPRGLAWASHVIAGGYPEMRRRADPKRRQAWARAYVNALVERDVRDVAQIDHLAQMPKLLAACAAQCAQLMNVAALGGLLNLNAKTAEKYIGIFEQLFLLQRVPAWSRNELKRLVRTPKLYFLDAGLQAALMRFDASMLYTHGERFGVTLETWVYAELRKLVRASDERWTISHFRDKDGVEVDFVLELPTRELIGIEVKASSSVHSADFKGLRRLQSLAGRDLVNGLLLYNGDKALSFGDGLWAVPLWAL